MPPLGNIESLRHALPELVLSVGVLLVLATGFRSRVVDRHLPAGLALVTLLVAMVATVAMPARGATTAQGLGLFEGLIARDPFADFFKLLACAAGIFTILIALRARDAIDFSASRTTDRESPEFFALIVTAVLGVALMGAATDLLMAYLALELTSIMSYVLAGFTRGSRRSAEAALKYVVYGGVASGAMLYGFSLAYGLAGSTDLTSVRQALAAAPTPVALTVAALCLAGFGYKVAIVPFHMWCPDVYEGAPTPVAAFLSVAPKAGGFALLIRFFTEATPSAAAPIPWAMLTLVIAVATMTFGNLAALSQTNIKRLLAYSSIAHAGTLFAGLAVGPAGIKPILFYLGAYLFMNLAAFAVVVAVVDETPVGAPDPERITSWAGLSRRAPLAAVVMTAALMALAGLPPTGGFVAKYSLFAALISAGREQTQPMFALVALIAVANSVLSLGYYLRVVRAMYIDPEPVGNAVATVGPRSLAMPLTVVLVMLLAGTIGLGLAWGPLDALTTASLGRWSPPALP